MESVPRVIPVVLSGGVGSRLWPLSRKHCPKQLLALVGARSMFQETVDRVSGVAGISAPLIVCNEDLRFLIAQQLQDLDLTPRGIILEPVGRNTAPAAAVAALECLRTDEDPLMLVLPADHVICDVPGFQHAVEVAAPFAENGFLVTFGVRPERAETGYGYIRVGERLDGKEVRKVSRFYEKPDAPSARSYVECGDFLWNSGMFLFRASTFLRELKRSGPEMVGACEKAMGRAARGPDFIRLDPEAFSACPADSIDYAVMQDSKIGAVVPIEVGWSDVGSWKSLWEISERDGEGNVIHGDVTALNVKDSYLRAERRLVAAVGVNNVVVVETADAVLVAGKDCVQDVKDVVGRLERENREQTHSHRFVGKPWGGYETLERGEGYQVKRITVNPASSLSLQLHRRRAEHWVVVRGLARVTVGDEIRTLSEDQSVYIPAGAPHRLENPGPKQVEFIEVQTGGYLGEDDIVRFQDLYGREDST